MRRDVPFTRSTASFQGILRKRELGLKKGRQTTLSILPRVFAKDVLPLLGKRWIYGVKRPDLLEVIARIERRKVLSVAEKVRTWFNQMFRCALVVVPGLAHHVHRRKETQRAHGHPSRRRRA